LALVSYKSLPAFLAVDNGTLFANVNQNYASITTSTHDFVFETMFSYIKAKLVSVHKMDDWTRLPATGAMLEMQFSLSPSVSLRDSVSSAQI